MKVLEKFFLGIADRNENDIEHMRCCMIVRATLSAPCNESPVGARIAGAIAELDEAFLVLLRRAADEGPLEKNGNLREVSRFLTTALQGLNIAALAGRSRRELREIVRRTLSSLH